MSPRKFQYLIDATCRLMWTWAMLALFMLTANSTQLQAENDPATPEAEQSKPAVGSPPEQPTPEESDDPDQILEAALQAMDNAVQELAGDAPTEAAVRDQELAIDLLHKLLSGASQSKSPPPESSSNEPQSSPDSSDKPSSDSNSSEPKGSGERRSDDENSTESSENVAGPTQSDTSDLASKARANSVWGHLPRREQESLLRSLSDNFLPEYEAQIKRYYEALAEGKTGSGGR